MMRDLGADLVLVGLSYRTAPVDVRQHHAYAVSELPHRVTALSRSDGVRGCHVVSTCNRTEVLALVDDGERCLPEFARRCFPDRDRNNEAFYHLNGLDAVFHLFCVAAGLDSQVLGESEILAQMRRSYDLCRDLGVLGPVLDGLLRQSLAVGRRVRRDTKLGEGTLSVASAAVELGARVFGTYDRVTAVVVGTGETGQLVARHLRARRISRLIVANRTLDRAHALAQEVGAEVYPIERLTEALSIANFVAVSVEAPEPVLRWEHVKQIKGRDRPVVFVDLSIPSAIESRVKSHPDILVHGLDDLDAIVGHHRAQRGAEVVAAERIIVDEAHKFLTLRHYTAMKPLVLELSRNFDEIQRATCAELGRETEDPLARRLAQRLLSAALETLKRGARIRHSEDEIASQFQSYVDRLGFRSHS